MSSSIKFCFLSIYDGEVTMNGAQWVVHALRAQGVDTIFGYPGGAIMPIYDALYDGGVEHLLCRHEQGAAMAAIGYARATGKTGVCMATSGPGATNLITGLADALLDSVPVVAITGQVASPFIGTDAFQEVDVLGLSLACTKHSFLVQSPGRGCRASWRKPLRWQTQAVQARCWLISRKISRLR
ncbi:Acetolactate synthase isozyme 2 large subunit [Leclercia adecarboxylata]|uniref:Acetolactate synthase isozyme 2 large subunit n=1 Tax=Leclercia adecarboxylata TaxID=83655 RepID=A0A4U9IWP3_9ENTR|nr:Acetolactate synthase isozyme 2 large subunit [Leclercia adecarboxylata]